MPPFGFSMTTGVPISYPLIYSSSIDTGTSVRQNPTGEDMKGRNEMALMVKIFCWNYTY
jgi:hypothetical protein